MRRLTNSRASHPDSADLEGFESTRLEGDPIEATPGSDAIASLRPFGRDVAESGLCDSDLLDGRADERELAIARALAARGRRLDAVISLRKLVADRPELVEPRVELASLLAGAGELEAAVEELGATLDIASSPAPILVLRGSLHAQMGRPREAEGDFREAIRRDVKHWPAYRYLGVTRLRLGAAGDAIELLREALTLAPQDPEAMLYLGEALLTQGELEEADRFLTQAVAAAPADPRGYKLLGRLFDRRGLTDEAMAMHKKAREATTP